MARQTIRTTTTTTYRRPKGAKAPVAKSSNGKWLRRKK